MIRRLAEILGIVAPRHVHRFLPSWSISEDSSPFAVSNGIPWLLRASGDEFRAIGHRLARLMREFRPEDWPRAYCVFRYVQIQPPDIRRLLSLPPDDAVEMLGVASLNSDGHVRETALQGLERLRHPRSLIYVFPRLGDWVPQVRHAAARLLRALMDVGIADELMTRYCLIRRLDDVKRVDLRGIRKEIEVYLRSPDSLPSVRRALESQDAGQRMFAFQLLEPLLDRMLLDKALAVE